MIRIYLDNCCYGRPFDNQKDPVIKKETQATEIFISKISDNDFDYTTWRENLWEDLTPKELFERAAKTEEKYSIPKGIEVI